MAECYKVCVYYSECFKARVLGSGAEVQQAGELLDAARECTPTTVGGYFHCAVLEAAKRALIEGRERGEKPKTRIMKYFRSMFMEHL